VAHRMNIAQLLWRIARVLTMKFDSSPLLEKRAPETLFFAPFPSACWPTFWLDRLVRGWRPRDTGAPTTPKQLALLAQLGDKDKATGRCTDGAPCVKLTKIRALWLDQLSDLCFETAWKIIIILRHFFKKRSSVKSFLTRRIWRFWLLGGTDNETLTNSYTNIMLPVFILLNDLLMTLCCSLT